MSEKHRVHHEVDHQPERHVEHQEQAQKQAPEKPRQHHEKSHENIAKIRELARQEAEASQKVRQREDEPDQADSSFGLQHSLKATAYERILAKTQQHLPKAARVFSRLTHNPAIDKVSSLSAATVARPSGFLGGSIVAFLGSATTLYMAKHYGFRYNYFVLFVLFIAGYAVGATIELLVWLTYSRKHRS